MPRSQPRGGRPCRGEAPGQRHENCAIARARASSATPPGPLADEERVAKCALEDLTHMFARYGMTTCEERWRASANRGRVRNYYAAVSNASSRVAATQLKCCGTGGGETRNRCCRALRYFA